MARFTRLLVVVSLAAWLAACAIVAPVPGAQDRTGAPAAATLPNVKPNVTATQPAMPGAGLDSAADVAVEPAASLPTGSTPQVELLAGEVPREFERGGASWYGPRFHGRRTASGERYDMHGFTAAHRTLPFGTMVRVRSMVSGHEVDVRVTDRGPFSHNRVIDVSRGAAQALGMLGLGVKPVMLLVPESIAAVAKPSPAARKPRWSRRPPAIHAGQRPGL